jgi:hypothetical protein
MKPPCVSSFFARKRDTWAARLKHLSLSDEYPGGESCLPVAPHRDGILTI